MIAMDISALNLKCGSFVWRNRKEQGSVLITMRQRSQLRYFAIEERNALLQGDLDFRISARRVYSSLVVWATGNDNSSFPGEDDPDQTNPDESESKYDDSDQISILSDWRDFRASLVIQEQMNLLHSDAPTDEKSASKFSQWGDGSKWAHPLSMPESGCVLIATDKLDGICCFERTVVLLLRMGTRDHQDGPFGIIINRSLNHWRIKHMNPLPSTFGDCPLYFGGPLDATMFLLKGESSAMPGLEQVIPGICFGARNRFDEAAELVEKGVLHVENFRFFEGYAGWQINQLRQEIESDYWVVAACSSHLIAETSADTCSGLWEEILQLMGG